MKLLWKEIMSVGEFIDNQGTPHSFTLPLLQKIAESYDPAFREAPVVIGHPKNDAPAFGWVRQLKVEGGKLWAGLELVPEFARVVKDGLYKKVSVALTSTLYLRHVGFLGAVQPAVPGLKDLKFADGDDAVRLFEFANHIQEVPKMTIEELLRMLEELKAKLPPELAAKVDEFIADLKEPSPAPGTQMTQPDPKVTELSLEVRRLRDDRTREKVQLFCAAQLLAGRIIPADMDGGMEELLFTLAQSSGEIEFSQGKKQTPLVLFQEFIGRLKPRVEFDQKTAGGGHPAEGEVEFSESDRKVMAQLGVTEKEFKQYNPQKEEN